MLWHKKSLSYEPNVAVFVNRYDTRNKMLVRIMTAWHGGAGRATNKTQDAFTANEQGTELLINIL